MKRTAQPSRLSKLRRIGSGVAVWVSVLIALGWIGLVLHAQDPATKKEESFPKPTSPEASKASQKTTQEKSLTPKQPNDGSVASPKLKTSQASASSPPPVATKTPRNDSAPTPPPRGKAAPPSSPAGIVGPSPSPAVVPGPPASPGPPMGGLPARYQVIAEKNLFRRLGWEPPAPRNPFTLVGVVEADNGKRALISREGIGLYVGIGEEVGQGYRVASIDGYGAKLTGGPMGDLTIQLDQEMIGAPIAGAGGGPMPVKGPSAPTAKTPSKETRWYPARGVPLPDLIRQILEKEGVSWQELQSNKDLQQKLRKKYGYLQEEGYAQFDD